MVVLPDRVARIVVALFAALAISACAGDEEGTQRYAERPVQELYNEAVDALRDKQYIRAAERFDDVERQHPYSVWAVKASLMAAFAHYQATNYDDAILALDRFIQLHPGNADIAYAYYLRALCSYEQISDVVRDQLNTEKALTALQEVVRRFPGTAYARDARLKIDLTRDHLAGKEMDVGRYYQTRGHYLAAVRRFTRVVEVYETTTHVPEALHRLTEAYLALGLKNEATKAAAVLGHNYPGSAWYADSYALVGGGPLPKPDERGFLRRTFDWVF